MDVEICEANAGQAAEISSLTGELGYMADVANTQRWLSHLINSENHQVLVAVNDTKAVCGWIVIEQRLSLETGFKAEITGLIVGQSHRRFGIGKKLVCSAVAWAKKAGLEKVVVRSNIQREASHAFYKEIGFRLKKTAHNYEISIE